MELTSKNGNLGCEEFVGIAEDGKDFMFFVFSIILFHTFLDHLYVKSSLLGYTRLLSLRLALLLSCG